MINAHPYPDAVLSLHFGPASMAKNSLQCVLQRKRAPDVEPSPMTPMVRFILRVEPTASASKPHAAFSSRALRWGLAHLSRQSELCVHARCGGHIPIALTMPSHRYLLVRHRELRTIYEEEWNVSPEKLECSITTRGIKMLRRMVQVSFSAIVSTIQAATVDSKRVRRAHVRGQKPDLGFAAISPPRHGGQIATIYATLEGRARQHTGSATSATHIPYAVEVLPDGLCFFLLRPLKCQSAAIQKDGSGILRHIGGAETLMATTPSVRCLQLVILAVDLSVSIDYWSVRTEVIDLQGKLLSLPPPAVDVNRGIYFCAGNGPSLMFNRSCEELTNGVERLGSNGAFATARKVVVAPVPFALRQLRFTAPYSLLAQRVVASVSRTSFMARKRPLKWPGARRQRQTPSDVIPAIFHWAPFFRHSATLFPEGQKECKAKSNGVSGVQKRVDFGKILPSPNVARAIRLKLPVIESNIDAVAELVPDIHHQRLNIKDRTHRICRRESGRFLHRTSFSFSRTQGGQRLRLSEADIRRNPQKKCSPFCYSEAVLTTLESHGALLFVIDRGMPRATSVLRLVKGYFRRSNWGDATTSLWGGGLKTGQRQWQHRAAQFWIAIYSRVGRLLGACSRAIPLLYSRGFQHGHISSSPLSRSPPVPILILVSLFDAVQGALRCSPLRHSFMSTGGPLWLSAVHLLLPELLVLDPSSSSPASWSLRNLYDCQVYNKLDEGGLKRNSAGLDSYAHQKCCSFSPTSPKVHFHHVTCRELQTHWQYGFANAASPLVVEAVLAEYFEELPMPFDRCMQGLEVSVLPLMPWLCGDEPAYYTAANCIFRREDVPWKFERQCHSAHYITPACLQRASGCGEHGNTSHHCSNSSGDIDGYVDGLMVHGGIGSLPAVPEQRDRTLRTLQGRVDNSNGALGRVVGGSRYWLPTMNSMPTSVSTCGSNGANYCTWKGLAWLSKKAAEVTGTMAYSSCFARARSHSNLRRVIKSAPYKYGPIDHAERVLHGSLHTLIETLAADTGSIVEFEALARIVEVNLIRLHYSDLSAGNVVVAASVLIRKAEARAFSRRSHVTRSKSCGFPNMHQRVLVNRFSGDKITTLRSTTHRMNITSSWLPIIRCSAQAGAESEKLTRQERYLPCTSVQALHVQRQRWVHQLCCCALERSAHCSLLFRNMKPLQFIVLAQSDEQHTGDQNLRAEALNGASSIAGDYRSWSRACCMVLSPLHDFAARASGPLLTRGGGYRALAACDAYRNDTQFLETMADAESVRSAISEIYAPSIHAVVAVFDALLECCTIDTKSRDGGNIANVSACPSESEYVHPRRRRFQSIGLQRACLHALLRELAECKKSLEVLSAHIGWLLSPGLVNGRRSSIEPQKGAPRYGMLPLMQRQAIRFLRRLTETCSKLQVSSPLAYSPASAATGYTQATVCVVCDALNEADPANIASTALSAGAILLFWQGSDVYSCLRNWLDAYASDIPVNPRRNGMGIPLQMQAASWHHTNLQDILCTLVATLSTDARKLTGQNSVLLVRPIFQLLCAASSKAAVMEHTSKPAISYRNDVGFTCPLRVLCRLCLHLLAALVDGRSVEEALEFHHTGAIRMLLRIVLGVSAVHEPVLSGVPDEFTKDVPLKGAESKVTPCSTALVDEVTYNVGDRIRARWILHNGKSRWYPGEIQAIRWKADRTDASSATYTVRYDDGDVEHNKRSADIKAPSVNDPLRRAGSASKVCAQGDVAPSTLKVVKRASTSNNAVADLLKRDSASNDHDGGESNEIQSNVDDGSEGSLESDDSNGMFMIIPSNLPSSQTGKPPAGRSIRTDTSHSAPTGVDLEHSPSKWQGPSLSIDLRTVHSVASSKVSSLSTLDPLAGFSSLSGFGMSSLHSTLPSRASASTSSSVSLREKSTGVLACGGDNERHSERKNSSMAWIGADPVSNDLALLSLLSLCVAPGGRSIEASALEPIALAGGKANWDGIVWKPTCSWESVFFSYEHTDAVAPGIDLSSSDLLAVVHRYFCFENSQVFLGLRWAPPRFPAVYRLFVRCNTRRSKSTAILLQLLCPLLFDSGLYGMGWGNGLACRVDANDGEVLGQGAFGKVLSMRCPGAGVLPGGASRVAVKLCNMEGNALRRVFNEIAVMKLSESKLTCSDVGIPAIGPSLLDYGFSAERDEFVLVMEQCLGGSLKVWRDRFDDAGRDKRVAPGENCVVEVTTTTETLKRWRALLYLEIFREVARSVCELADRGIIHFDLKCDNILLRDYLDSSSLLCAKSDRERAMQIEGIRRRLRTGLVCIGDFGEACIVEGSIASSGVSLAHARGTECIQSPEVMLMSDRTVRTYDVPKQVGAASDHRVGSCKNTVPTWKERVPGQASSCYERGYPSCLSDVWSLGCLLFELMTGDFLFNVPPSEGGWSRLFVLLVHEKSEIFLEQKMELLREKISSGNESAETSALTVVGHLLRSLLVRNPNNRPTARQALRLVDESIAVLTQTMPTANSEYKKGINDEVKQWQDIADFEPITPNKKVGAFQPTASCQPLMLPIVAKTPHEHSQCCRALFIWPALVHPDLPVLVASRDCDRRSVDTTKLCPSTLLEPPATLRRALVLPYVWMDAALPFEETRSCEEADVLEALGISHTVHIEWASNGKLIAILSILSVGNHLNLPCGAGDDTGLSLAPQSIDRITRWTASVRQEGGRVLITSSLFWPLRTISWGRSADVITAANDAVSTLAVAVHITAGSRNTYDALLAIRSTHRAFSLARPEDIAGWLKWRAEYKGLTEPA